MYHEQTCVSTYTCHRSEIKKCDIKVLWFSPFCVFVCLSVCVRVSAALYHTISCYKTLHGDYTGMISALSRTITSKGQSQGHQNHGHIFWSRLIYKFRKEPQKANNFAKCQRDFWLVACCFLSKLCFWRHDVTLTPRGTLNVITYFVKAFDVCVWCHEELFWRILDISLMLYNEILMSWLTFWCHDVPSTSWRYFDLTTYFLTSWRTFWLHDVCWRQNVLFDVMPYFWRHDVTLTSLCSCHYKLCVSAWRILDVPLTS